MSDAAQKIRGNLADEEFFELDSGPSGLSAHFSRMDLLYVMPVWHECSRALTEVDGVHSLLLYEMIRYIRFVFVTLQTSGVPSLLMASTHLLF